MRRDPDWDLETIFRAALDSVLATDSRVLLAVSGGADSTAMMCLFASDGRYEVEVATVDHALREGSAKEAELVHDWAEELGLIAHTIRLDGAALADGNLQGNARKARYEALRKLAEERCFTHIAVAHTMDDQAETVLDRITRGASFTGIRALRSHGDLLRPLLGIRRRALVAYLHRRDQPFVCDPSNIDERFKRIRIRKLLRDLSAEDPQLVTHLSQLAEDAALLTEHLDAQLDFALDDIICLREVTSALRRHALKTLLAQRDIRARRRHLEDLEDLVLRGRGQVLLGKGIAVSTRSGRLVFDDGHIGRSQRSKVREDE